MIKKILTVSAISGLMMTSITFAKEQRIVVLGPGTAELVVALDKEKNLVGVGRTSRYPTNLQKDYPVVGYVHRAPAEGLLSVNPTHVIGTGNMGPEKTIETLKSSNVKLYLTKVPQNTDDVVTNIQTLGNFLGESDKAEKMAKSVTEDFKAVTKAAKDLPKKTYALVWYYRGKVGTRGASDAITTINWSGAINVYGDVAGRTDVTRESLLARDPDVIFLYASSLRRLKDEKKTFEDLPGFRETKAYKNKQVYVMPGFVSSMGPRTPHAINFMIGKLHGKKYQANLPERPYAPLSSMTEE